jgi:hypothetical protein
MIGELIYSLMRIGIYFFVFYFLYRVIKSFLRGLMGDDKKPRPSQSQQPSPKKHVQTYTDVEEAKFKDIPPESKEPS